MANGARGRQVAPVGCGIGGHESRYSQSDRRKKDVSDLRTPSLLFKTHPILPNLPADLWCHFVVVATSLVVKGGGFGTVAYQTRPVARIEEGVALSSIICMEQDDHSDPRPLYLRIFLALPALADDLWY